MCDEDEDIGGSKLTLDSDLSTRMGVGHYIIIAAPLSMWGHAGRGWLASHSHGTKIDER